MKSGYMMIDCHGMDLLGGSTPQTITGIYEKMDSALKYGKAVFAQNCVYGTGHPMTPIAVMIQREDEHTIVATSSILQIWVTDGATNNVTIASLVTANRTTKGVK